MGFYFVDTYISTAHTDMFALTEKSRTSVNDINKISFS